MRKQNLDRFAEPTRSTAIPRPRDLARHVASALIDQFALLDRAALDLISENHKTFVDFMRLSEEIRGFGHFKERNATIAAVRRRELIARLARSNRCASALRAFTPALGRGGPRITAEQGLILHHDLHSLLKDLDLSCKIVDALDDVMAKSAGR